MGVPIGNIIFSLEKKHNNNNNKRHTIKRLIVGENDSLFFLWSSYSNDTTCEALFAWNNLYNVITTIEVPKDETI